MSHKIAFENPSRTQWRSARDNNIVTCCKETITSFVECIVPKPSFKKPRRSQTLVACLFVCCRDMDACRVSFDNGHRRSIAALVAVCILLSGMGTRIAGADNLWPSFKLCLLLAVASLGRLCFQRPSLLPIPRTLPVRYRYHILSSSSCQSLPLLHQIVNSFLPPSQFQFLPCCIKAAIPSSITASISSFLHQSFNSSFPASVLHFLPSFIHHLFSFLFLQMLEVCRV